MSHYLLEDLNNLYAEVNQYENSKDFNDIVETVFSDLVYSLASEGYSAKGIVSYLSHTPEQEIVEYYLNINNIQHQVSEDYIQEQVDLINEGLGSFLKVLGGGLLRGGKSLGKGVVTAAKSTGSTLKTATKTGFPQTSQKLSGAVTKIKDVLKTPAAKIGAGVLAVGGAYGLGRMQGGGSQTKAKVSPSKPPAPKLPELSSPAGGSSTGPGSSKPGNAKGNVKTPSKEDINKEYEKLRQKDPASAEKYGLEQWKKLYPKLAARLNPDGTQKGSRQSEMEKQSDELKKIKPATKEEPGPQAKSELPGGDYSAAATKEMSQRTKNILGIKDEYDAYDLVLDYLLSEGHAETVSEANYVMMQMSAEYIQDIVEGMTIKDFKQ